MAYDPYYQLVPQPRELPFDPDRTALIVIDLQHGCAHPDGLMGRLAKEQGKPWLLQERWDFVAEILPRVRRLQDACRAASIEVIHVRVKYLTKDHRDGQRSLAREVKAQSSTPFDLEFIEMVAPRGDEIVVDKTSAGTFNSTALDQMLRNMGRDRLICAGVVTEGCVEMTARTAADRGYYTTLVSDGCASSTHLAHYDALQRMTDGGLIKARTVEEIIGQIDASRRVSAAA
ncbi:MAG: isochorismatase family cysteine hydrolase [Microvirga sp.]